MFLQTLIATNIAAASVAGFFYWQNGNLEEDVKNLEFDVSTLKGNLATQKSLLDAEREAAAVLRIQRAAAEKRAEEADALREAILENDNEAIESVGGPLGDALSLLRGLGGCGEGEVGHTEN